MPPALTARPALAERVPGTEAAGAGCLPAVDSNAILGRDESGGENGVSRHGSPFREVAGPVAPRCAHGINDTAYPSTVKRIKKGENILYERFTERARRSTVLAQDEARQLDHNYIGTEHLLLGLIHEGEGVAARVLNALGISLGNVRVQVESIIGRGDQTPSGHIPFTPRAKKVLELSLREALQLGHNYIGTEHILLGLIREGEGVAAQVLVKLGAELTRVRQQVIQHLSNYTTPDVENTSTPPLTVDPSLNLIISGLGWNIGDSGVTAASDSNRQLKQQLNNCSEYGSRITELYREQIITRAEARTLLGLNDPTTPKTYG